MEEDQGPVEVEKLGEPEQELLAGAVEQELLAGAVEPSLVEDMPTWVASLGAAALTGRWGPWLGERCMWLSAGGDVCVAVWVVCYHLP